MISFPLPISICCINRHINIWSIFRNNIAIQVFQFNISLIECLSCRYKQSRFFEFIIINQIFSQFNIHFSHSHIIIRYCNNNILFSFANNLLFLCRFFHLPKLYWNSRKFNIMQCNQIILFSLSNISFSCFYNIGICICIIR